MVFGFLNRDFCKIFGITKISKIKNLVNLINLVEILVQKFFVL